MLGPSRTSRLTSQETESIVSRNTNSQAAEGQEDSEGVNTENSEQVDGLSDLHLAEDLTRLGGQDYLLVVWENEKAKWLQHHLDRKWEEDGERSTKLFFNAIKTRKQQTTVHALKDDEGNLHTDGQKIQELALQYFANILQDPGPELQQLEATTDTLAAIQAQVSPAERTRLQQAFTSEELVTAAKLLGKNKCPGPDGMPVEFFIVMWDTVSPLLMEATAEGLMQGRLLPFFNRGMITLLQKDGDSTLLTNKRPITLLNAVYKVWAKALQLRLSPVLQRLVTWEQNAFLPGRNLHSTVFLCNEAVHEAKALQQDAVLLKIDFKKAFDTLRWQFIYDVMEKMQFGQAQSQAFVAKTVRWAYTPGQHPLKDWIRSKFQEIAELRWNSSHFTWVTSPSRGAFPPLSPLMLRVCKAWQTTAKLLAPLRNLPLLPWKKISLWGPKTPGIRGLTRSASKGQNARLKDARVGEIGDITDSGTIFRPIEDAVSGVPSPSNATRRAYDRLLSSTPRHTAGYRSHSLYATPHAANPTICIRLADEAPLDDTILNSTHARLAFQISEGTLLPSNLRDIPTETNWVRVPIATVWRPQGKQPARHVLSWEDSNSLIAALQWRDQSGFLAAPNANIRRIATTDTSTILDRIRKWVRSHHIDPTNVNRWLKLWKKKRPIKFSILQWNIFFRSIPTNTWRHPQLSRDQQETWCVCCDTRSAEDIQHLLWMCPIAAQIWEWAIDVTNIAFPETRRWTPRSTHTILGEDLPQHCKGAAYWWENWRLIILWSIWSQRNDMIFRNSRANLGKVKASAWNKLLVQTRKDWALHCKDTANIELTLLRRIDLDRRMTRRLAIQTLRLKITGHNLLGSWRPP
ncbi:hypothetical protein R1sor_009073 [Riccia sorocarpa]|uniref:Reverse transcriptase domain-containing protein n=1 Tax=Riccia sorocarpa TaxID=122646 RepID=A0ABD3H8N8_9MARC